MVGDPIPATNGTRKIEQGATTAAARPREYPMYSVPENGKPASTRAGTHTGVHSGPRAVGSGPGITSGAGGITRAHAGQNATVPYSDHPTRDDEYGAGPKQV